MTDLLGSTLTADERAVFEAYAGLKDLAARDLPPCAAAGVRVALAALGVVVTDLALEFEHLTDLAC